MGGFLSRGMEDTMNKQFDKQIEMQKIMVIFHNSYLFSIIF